jgi:hypothetical protein
LFVTVVVPLVVKMAVAWIPDVPVTWIVPEFATVVAPVENKPMLLEPPVSWIVPKLLTFIPPLPDPIAKAPAPAFVMVPEPLLVIIVDFWPAIALVLLLVETVPEFMTITLAP